MEIKKQKIDINYLFWCFIIFSVLGLILETIFCYITTGIFESRKGLIIGPFSPTYGIGAVCIILCLEKYKDNDIKILLFGGIIGGILEYIFSYCLEAVMGIRFWDYSSETFNLNGRICLIYIIYWCILSFILIKYIKPKIDLHIKNIKKNKIKTLNKILIIFFIINIILTIGSINIYKEKAKNKYMAETNEENIKNEKEIFFNKTMEKIFPNLEIRNQEENLIYIKNIIK